MTIPQELDARLDQVLAAFVDNALAEPDRQRILDLLAIRPDVAERVVELRALQDLLRVGLRADPPPERLDPDRRVALREAAVAHRPQQVGGSRRQQIWLPLVCSAAAAVLVLAVVVGRVGDLIGTDRHAAPGVETPLVQAGERSDAGPGDQTLLADRLPDEPEMPGGQRRRSSCQEEIASKGQATTMPAQRRDSDRVDQRTLPPPAEPGPSQLWGHLSTAKPDLDKQPGMTAVGPRWRQPLAGSVPTPLDDRVRESAEAEGPPVAFGKVLDNKLQGEDLDQLQSEAWNKSVTGGKTSAASAPVDASLTLVLPAKPPMMRYPAKQVKKDTAQADATKNRVDVDAEDLEHNGSLDLVDEADVKGREEAKATVEVGVGTVYMEPEQRPEAAGPGITPPTRPIAPVNPWVLTDHDRLSTFALDVDTASYALTQRHLRDGYLPPAAAVRVEEFVNAFDYNYPVTGEQTFQVHCDLGPAPFCPGASLLKIGVKARVLGRDQQKPAHLVFVIDTSGSMGQADRLPLLVQGVVSLLERLDVADRISLVTYGATPSLVLEAVPATEQERIRAALQGLRAGGSTNLERGLALGYQLARQAYVSGQVNRVILCSDGVANLGQATVDGIRDQVVAQRSQGIGCTTVGVGVGAYNDPLLESVANHGDGSYLYVGSADDTQRVFGEELGASLHLVAKDAKIQVDFHPARVRRYRLLGYENRDIADADFRNDAVDAGEVGSGQAVTALYEVELHPGTTDHDLGSVAVRYQDVVGNGVRELAYRLPASATASPVTADPRFHLAACAAEFAEMLRGSEHAAGAKLADLEALAATVAQALPRDTRAQELVTLIRRARGLPRAP